MTPNTCIFHYGEIATKSGNRVFFEKHLAANIMRLLGPAGVRDVRIVRGAIVGVCDGTLDIALVRQNVRFLFGLEHVRLAVRCEVDLAKISGIASTLVSETNGNSFKIDTRRSDKNFPKKSMEVSAEIGAVVLDKTGKRVDVHTPDIVCVIDIGPKAAFISTTQIQGPGGLPVGSQSPIMVMLSGGIDSPVAALRMERRGAPVFGLHFHSYPFTNRASLDKVKELAAILAVPQGTTRVWFLSFADVQKKMVQHAPPELRVILYRRSMFRIAQALARKNGVLALATGESLGQVASQTVENIAAVNEAVAIPVLRPLIGTNKSEIIDEARTYGTYDISIRPHDDCCSLFLPPHPETRARLDVVLAAEKLIPGLADLEASALANAEESFIS
jgi:thiamine biosynthesis protein ThiI